MQFVATKFHSVNDKIDFAKRFKKFVESDFDRKIFTKKFYQRMSNCFGHIAHYDQNGFFSVWFSSTKDKVRFLHKIVTYPCFGDASYTFSDVEKFLQNWVNDGGYLLMYQKHYQAEVEAAERKQLESLKRKYG